MIRRNPGFCDEDHVCDILMTEWESFIEFWYEYKDGRNWSSWLAPPLVGSVLIYTGTEYDTSTNL